MASLLTVRGTRASLLSLPPAVRTLAYQNTRSFSATGPNKLSLIDIAVAGPIALIDGLHNLGLPWYAALPTAAVLVRGVLVYRFSALPARRKAQVQAHLVPLASARVLWRQRTPEDMEALKKTPILIRGLTRVYQRNMELHRMGKLFGAPRYTWRSFLNFGMLIAFTESIRMKCGTREGLLPLLLSPFEWLAKALPLVTVPHPQPTGTRQIWDNMRAVWEGTPTAQKLQTKATQFEYPGADKISAYFDPSLENEGLSWCLDLTSPDPSLMLPVALGATFVLNTIYRPRLPKSFVNPDYVRPEGYPRADMIGHNPDATYRSDSVSIPPLNPTQFPPPPPSFASKLFPPITNLQRIFMLFALALTAAAFKMPAAILLYFIPNLMMGWVQQRYLDWKYPLQPPIQPCARPLRYKVRKEWVD